MGQVEIKWEQQRLRGGALLERWHAHMVKPFHSLEFAWLIRRGGVWHLDVMLRDGGIHEVAIYRCRRPNLPMRHVQRWIASGDRWNKLVLADGAVDPRGKFDRFAPDSTKHHFAVQIYEMNRGKPCPFGGLD